MSLWQTVRAYHHSIVNDVDNRAGGRLSSTPANQPPMDDEFSSPLDYAPRAFDGPAPRAARKGNQHQEVWDMIARKHPRKFRAAIRYIKWMERMERRYETRIL